MKIVGLDHVQIAIPVGGERRARKFYGGLLGLEEIDKPSPLLERGGCWFITPGMQIHLGVQEPFVAALKAHPAFLVPDLEAMRVLLQAAEVAVIDDHSLAGVHRFYAHDPFGNRLEFIQDGEGFSQ